MNKPTQDTTFILYFMDGSKTILDINDLENDTIHTLIYKLEKSEYIYTFFQYGTENKIYTNTKLNTFNVNQPENTVSLFVLKTLLDFSNLTSSTFNSHMNTNHYKLHWNNIKYNNPEVRTISDLCNLHKLHISNWLQLKHLNLISKLSNLQELHLNNCNELTDLEPISHINNLYKLTITKCYSLSNLEPLGDLNNLYELHLNECDKISNLIPLFRLWNLHILTFTKCDKIIDLSPIRLLPKLYQLTIQDCNKIVAMKPRFDKVDDYERYKILYGPRRATAMRIKSKLNHSRRMILIGLTLKKMTKLRKLHIINCKSLTDLSQFRQLNRLRVLEITNCTNVKNLKSLNKLLPKLIRPFD